MTLPETILALVGGVGGVGSAGAEPTSWTAAGVMVRTGTTARVPWAFVIYQANRGGAGTVTAVLSTIVYTVLQ